MRERNHVRHVGCTTKAMKTTIGQLVATVFDKHQHRFHNTELATLATHLELEDLAGVQRLRVGMGVGVAEAASAASRMRSDAWERSQ